MLAAWLCGCGGSGSAWAELGAGERAFHPLDPGDDVEIVRGPQGGYMIALAVQAGGVQAGDPTVPTVSDNPLTTFEARLSDDPDGEPLGRITVALGLTAVDEVLELAGIWVIFDSQLPPETYFNADLDLTVEVVDARGRAAHDAQWVRATWSEPQ